MAHVAAVAGAGLALDSLGHSRQPWRGPHCTIGERAAGRKINVVPVHMCKVYLDRSELLEICACLSHLNVFAVFQFFFVVVFLYCLQRLDIKLLLLKSVPA